MVLGDVVVFVADQGLADSYWSLLALPGYAWILAYILFANGKLFATGKLDRTACIPCSWVYFRNVFLQVFYVLSNCDLVWPRIAAETVYANWGLVWRRRLWWRTRRQVLRWWLIVVIHLEGSRGDKAVLDPVVAERRSGTKIGELLSMKARLILLLLREAVELKIGGVFLLSTKGRAWWWCDLGSSSERECVLGREDLCKTEGVEGPKEELKECREFWEVEVHLKVNRFGKRARRRR